MADETAQRRRIKAIWEELQGLSLVVRCGEDGIAVIGAARESPEAQEPIRRLEREYAADPKLVRRVVGGESRGGFGSGRRGGPIPSRYE